MVQSEQVLDLRGAVGVGGGDAGVSGTSCGERSANGVMCELSTKCGDNERQG